MISKRIIPECFGDNLLIEVIGYPRQNHQKGISKVLNTISAKYQGQTAIGIVDDDKRKPVKIIETYQFIREENGLKVLQKMGSENYLIFICPALERWIWNASKAANLDPQDYNITDIEALKRKTKNIHIKKDQDLYHFFKAINRLNPAPVQSLKRIIEEILNKT